MMILHSVKELYSLTKYLVVWVLLRWLLLPFHTLEWLKRPPPTPVPPLLIIIGIPFHLF